MSVRPVRPVPRPVLTMRWQAVTYVHWDLDPEVVARRLPPGLVPDVHDGRAWVGLVPFRMAGIRLGRRFGLPLGTFPETNVRTYVVGPDGGRGVYFHSLDVTRLPPTLVARLGYRLPYCWSRMAIGRRGDDLAYLAQRRWPDAGARSHLRVRVGDRVRPEEIEPVDVFLTARWSLYAATPTGRLLRAHVAHDPWPLRAAEVLHLDDGRHGDEGLLAAAGYHGLGARRPVHVRHGGDVEVEVGGPRRVSPALEATSVS